MDKHPTPIGLECIFCKSQTAVTYPHNLAAATYVKLNRQLNQTFIYKCVCLWASQTEQTLHLKMFLIY